MNAYILKKLPQMVLRSLGFSLMRKDTFDRLLVDRVLEKERSERQMADAKYRLEKLSVELDAYRRQLSVTEGKLREQLASYAAYKEAYGVQRMDKLAGELDTYRSQLLASSEEEKQKAVAEAEQSLQLKSSLDAANDEIAMLKARLSELSLLHAAKQLPKNRPNNIFSHNEQLRVDSLPLWALWGPYTKQQSICSQPSSSPLEFASICDPAVMMFTFPKSGSTFLELVMSEALGIKDVGAPFDSDVEGLRFEDIAVHGARYPFVIKNHVWSTPSNTELLNFFGIKPIVLVRNIYDCLLSLAEDSQFSTINDRVICTGYIRSDFASLPLEERLWIVIRGFLGWYLSFYVSWVRAIESQSVNGLFVSYETLMADPVATIKKIGKHVGAPMDDAFISSAIEKIGKGPHTRFNQGVIGRAQSVLTQEMKAAVIEAARVFAPVDFSPIGLIVPKA